MNHKLLLLIPLLACNLCFADYGITYYYAPSANVKGDLQEDDFNLNDDYSYLTLDPGIAKTLRWTWYSDTLLYAEYTTIKTEDKSGNISDNKYQSLSFGGGDLYRKKINRYYDIYGSWSLGLGAAKFDFTSDKYRAIADFNIEGGALLSERISLGVGVKYQIVGYPSETMADATILNFNIGVRF